jgi:hypothetical protein
MMIEEYAFLILNGGNCFFDGYTTEFGEFVNCYELTANNQFQLPQ